MFNISPDIYAYLQIAVASLFIIFLVTIFWGTKTKYFKDYGDIERKSRKKKG